MVIRRESWSLSVGFDWCKLYSRHSVFVTPPATCTVTLRHVGVWRYKIAFTYRHVFKEQVAPLILHIEEEPEDECDVHDADEEDHDHPRVDGEPVPPACLGALLSQSHHGQISGNYILRKDNSRKLLEHKKNTCWKTYKILLHCLCYPVRCWESTKDQILVPISRYTLTSSYLHG